MEYYCSNEELDKLVEILVIKNGFDPQELLDWLDRVKDKISIICPFPCAVEPFLGGVEYELISEGGNRKFDAVRDFLQNSRSFKLRVLNAVKRVKGNQL